MLQVLSLRHSIVSWLYQTVVEQIFLYGVSVWWTVADKKCHCDVIDRIRRQTSILIKSAMSTTPTKAMFAMLNWLPSNLLLAAVRLNAGQEITWAMRRLYPPLIMKCYTIEGTNPCICQLMN